LCAECDGVHRPQSAKKPAEALFTESAVFGNSAGDVRVRDLHKEGAAAAQQHDTFSVHPADHGVVGEGKQW
jgi:hypothetical protein